MKKLLLYAVMFCTIIAPVYTVAQYNTSNTYMRPFNLTTQNDDVSFSFPNGDTFNGHKFSNILNGTVTHQHYNGTYRTANGDIYITQKGGDGFEFINNTFGFYNGVVWNLAHDNHLYRVTFNNGEKTSQVEEYRHHFIDGNYLVLTTDYGGAYVGGNDNNSGDNQNNINNNTYDPHKAQCSGCHGNGKCQHCHGSGYVNNYKSTCSLCHGTGRCVSCSGAGFIRL